MRGIAIAFCAIGMHPSPVFALDKGNIAPQFNAPSMGGGDVSLASFKGRVVYLDFWASWCGPCRKSVPWLSELQKKYAEEGLVVLAVNEDSKRENAEKFLQDIHPAFTPLFDSEGAIAKSYAPPSMPSSYLIDRNGEVTAIFKGFHDGDEAQIESEIKTLLKNQETNKSKA